MRTALDTNVISCIWSRQPLAGEMAERLWRFKQEGALLISPVVYAELLAHPRATEDFVNGFLTDTGIKTDFELSENTWRESGRRFARYADRRRQGAEQGPRRLLADFLIGAHAFLQADRLMTLDARRYRQDFPDLLLL